MFRRRRRVREIPFSFDSFLDVVANVVGIIIRLILVVWVGARSYSSVKNLSLPPSAEPHHVAEAGPLHDPLELELALHRQELEKLQSRLLEQLKELQLVQCDQRQAEEQVNIMAARAQSSESERTGLERTAGQQDQGVRQAELSLSELQQRRHAVAEQIKALELQPRKTQT